MKKKILFFSPSLSIGGAERVLVNLLNKIDLERYDISVCLLSHTGEYFNEIPKQIKVFSIIKSNFIARSLIFLKRKLNIAFPLKVLTKLTVKESYDVGISFSDGQLTDVLLFTKKHFKTKIAWVHSCYISQTSLYKAYTPQLVRKLKKTRYQLLNDIVFVSENAKTEFEELFGINTNTHVIHNIFDTETIIKKSSEPLLQAFDDDVVNIVAVGRLVAVKEYSKLIRAAKLLVDKNVKFKVRIIGDGILMNQLKSEVRELSLENHVDFIGFTPNPYPYLKQSNLLALTSSSEALPTVLAEAMTLGLPIVATSCSGAMELTANGNYGLLTKHSVADIAEKLERMITDRELREHYAVLGLKRLEFFSEEKILEKIYNILG